MLIKDIINSFNSIIQSFLSQISDEIGTSYSFHFKNLIKVNSQLPIQHALTHLLPYKNIINNKNESYFLEDENVYVNKLNELNELKKLDFTQILSEIFRLKNIYVKLDKNSKEHLWSMLQALVQLCIEYCKIKKLSIDDNIFIK